MELQLKDKQQLYNGFGNGLARAFELAVTPALFGFLGHLVDRAAGTSPVFLIVFVILCITGMGLRMYYGYVEAMKAHEAEAVWNRPRAPSSRSRGGAP